MANSLALVWDLIAVDHASGTFARVGTAADTSAGSVKRLVEGFGLLAAGGVVTAAVKQAADFQKQMLLIQTQSGDTTDNLKTMSDAILGLAGPTAQAPEALATSLRHMTDIGLRGSDAINAVRVAAEGAAVGHADLEATTNSLTSTIASNMVPATETYSQVMGQLNAIVGAGDMSMTNLNDALSNGLLPTMHLYGVSLTQVGAALATFGDVNLRGQVAATDLRMAVQSFFKLTQDGPAILAKYHLSQQQLIDDLHHGGLTQALTDLHDKFVAGGVDASHWGEIITQVFGKKAGVGLSVLLDEFDRYNTKLKQVSDGTNAFGSAWEKTQKTASFQFAQLKDTVDALGIQIGTHLLPVAGDLASWLSQTGIPDLEKFGGFLGNVYQGFTQLPGPVKGFVLALAAVKALDMAGWLQPVIGGIRALGAGAGTMSMQVRTAFAEAKAAQLDLMGSGGLGGSLVARATGNLAGLGAAAGEAASGGFSLLRSAGSNLVNFLGGPWGIAFAGAAVAIPGLIEGVKLLTGNVIDAKVAQEDFTSALEATNGVMDQSIRKDVQNQLTKAGVIDSFKRAGISAQDAIDGILGNAAAQDRVNQKLQDFIDHAPDGQGAHSKLATAAASSRDAYAQLTGAFGSSRQALDYFDQGAGQSTQTTGLFTGAINTLKTAINNLPAFHNTVVTADTTPAQNTINGFLQRVQAQGFVGALFNLKPIGSGGNGGNPVGLPPIPGHAFGGPISGPGSGTSDSVLIAASNGEHMWTAAEVAAAGGHAAVEQLRANALSLGRGFAGGGPIATTPWLMNYPVDLNGAAKANLSQQLSQLTSFSGTGAGSPFMKILGQAIAASMGYAAQFNAIDYIFSHESGWNPLAQNPTSTAFGIPQFLNSTWGAYGGKTTDAAQQIRDGIMYMRDRYGSPNAAAAFWAAHHWYRNGTNYVPSDQLAVLHRGEAVVPASQNQGAPYQGGRSGPLMHVEHQHIHDQVDLELALRDAQFRERTGAFS